MLLDLPEVLLEDIARLLDARVLACLARAHTVLRTIAKAAGRARLLAGAKASSKETNTWLKCVHPPPESLACVLDVLCFIELPYDLSLKRDPSFLLHNWAGLLECHEVLEVVLRTSTNLGDHAYTKPRLKALEIYSISPDRIRIEMGDHAADGRRKASLVLQARGTQEAVPLLTVPADWSTSFDGRDRRRGRRNAMLPSEFPSEMRPREHQHLGVLRRVQLAVAEYQAEIIAAINFMRRGPYTFSARGVMSFGYMVWKVAMLLLETPTAFLRMVPYLMIVVASMRWIVQFHLDLRRQ